MLDDADELEHYREQVKRMSGQIIDRVDLANEGGSLVLYDWMAEDVSDGRNLIRVDPTGNILWKALPPTTGMQD